MRINFSSLRTQFISMIALLSSVGVVSSVIILNSNYKNTIEDTKQSALNLIKHETEVIFERHNSLLGELGLRIQKNSEFRNAIKNKNGRLARNFLNEEFHLYFATTGLLIINKLYILDTEYELLAESNIDIEFNSSSALCPQLSKVAKKRKGIDRLRIISSVCRYKEHTLNSVLIPIGTLKPIGYLQIISQPYNLFSKAADTISIPLRLITNNPRIGFQTPDWNNEYSQSIIITHELKDINNSAQIFLEAKKDISRLHASFTRSRALIITVVGFITLLGITLIYFRFDKYLLRPLKALENQLALLEKDKKQMGNLLTPKGSPEIRSLTKKFNNLSSELSDSYNSLEKLAYNDSLTSLPNRSKLNQSLKACVALYHQKKTPFFLVTIDLNRFKSVNDSLGHKVGDVLLQKVSKRLLDKTGSINQLPKDKEEPINQVFRLGGDEFAVIFPGVGEEDTARSMVKIIISSLRNPYIIEKFNFNISFSIGIALCPAHGDSAETLLMNADLAMYHSKENHLESVVYNESLKDKSIDVLTMDTELREAIRNNELSLVYQPKVDLTKHKTIAAEVLIRWTHKQKGAIPPDKFITVAEQTGLINEITQWVLKTALKQKMLWENENLNFSLAINLSAKNLLDKNLLSFIKSELSINQVFPQSIYLELTETAIMSDPTYAKFVLQQLSNLGLNISIDDFGTGYSSLSYLKQLPVNEIKIDQSFIKDMNTDENDAVIVQSTIDLAHNMGLQVVAEGVETQQIYEGLSQHHCDLAQGYYIAKPMNAAEFSNWLKESQWGLA